LKVTLSPTHRWRKAPRHPAPPAIVLMSAMLDTVQECGAEKAADPLKASVALKELVLRGRQEVTVPGQDLVPGHAVLLAAMSSSSRPTTSSLVSQLLPFDLAAPRVIGRIASKTISPSAVDGSGAEKPDSSEMPHKASLSQSGIEDKLSGIVGCPPCVARCCSRGGARVPARLGSIKKGFEAFGAGLSRHDGGLDDHRAGAHGNLCSRSRVPSGRGEVHRVASRGGTPVSPRWMRCPCTPDSGQCDPRVAEQLP
jgi:hypothetical protein